MTLLHRWRFHPAFPCPPCIPESRCWPDRPRPWQRLARRRLVFRCLVAMDGLVSPLLSFRDKQGPVFGLGLGVGLELNIFRFLMKCRRWGKPIRALSRAWFSAGAVLAGVRESAVYGGSSCQARSRSPVMADGSWTRRPEAPVP